MEGVFPLLKTAGALALVLGLLFAFVYALRRWGNLVRKPASQPIMEVLSKQSFGPRHHLIVVEVIGERKVLVGIAPQTISFLSLHSPAIRSNDSFEEAIQKI